MLVFTLVIVEYSIPFLHFDSVVKVLKVMFVYVSSAFTAIVADIDVQSSPVLN